jgi:transcriptional regulator with XRE-family HTH domain
MLTIGQYLEKCKKKLNFKTYAEVARAADVSPAYLNQIRSGAHRCNDYVAVRLAKIMNEEPAKVLVIASYTTAAENIKPYYETLSEKLDLYLKNQKRPKKAVM